MSDDKTAKVTISDRKEKLATAVRNQVYNGGRIESRTDTYAVIRVDGDKVRHLLHLILTLLTGVWGIVWIVLVAKARKAYTVIVSVDEFGNTLETAMDGGRK